MTPERWRLIAFFAALGAAIVIGVVITRMSTSKGSSDTHLAKTVAVSANLVRAGDLGDVDGDQALRAKVEPGLPGGTAPSTRAKPDKSPVCAAQAGGLQPKGAVLTYVATARWQGTPADVFGFSPPGARATSSPGRKNPTRVYVLARQDCRLLVFQSFAP